MDSLRKSTITNIPVEWGKNAAAHQEKGRFLAVDVLKLVRESPQNNPVRVAGVKIKINHRIQVIAKYPKCVFCDMECVLAIVEKHKNHPTWTIHFYGEKDGEIVRLTVDHIVPKSVGGADHMENYQCSCHRCNQSKGNIITDPFAAAQIRYRGKHGRH